MNMTKDEYLFITGRWTGTSVGEYYKVGDACYENGWFDDMGITTPKGQKAVEKYEQEQDHGFQNAEEGVRGTLSSEITSD